MITVIFLVKFLSLTAVEAEVLREQHGIQAQTVGRATQRNEVTESHPIPRFWRIAGSQDILRKGHAISQEIS